MNKNKRKYTNEYLLDQLKELSQKLDRTPKARDIIKYSEINLSNYYRHFESLRNAQKLAGLKKSKNGNKKKYSKKNLLEEMIILSKKIGKTPSSFDIKNSGKINAYRKYFGSIKNAQKLAGLSPNKRGAQEKYSNKYLIYHLIELSKKLERIPKVDDILDAGKVSIKIFYIRFGNFKRALKIARLKNKSGIKSLQKKYLKV